MSLTKNGNEKKKKKQTAFQIFIAMKISSKPDKSMDIMLRS